MRKYLFQTKLLQIVIIILIILSNIIMVINSFMNIQMTNSIINLDLHKFLLYLAFVVGLMIAVSILNYVSGILQSKSKKEIALQIRRDYIQTYIDEYDLSCTKESTNKVISNLTNDTEFIINQYVSQLYIYINFLCGAIFPLLGATLIHWSFLFVFPLSALVSVIVTKKASPHIQLLSNEQSEENKNFIATLNNLFHGFSTLFSYNALNKFKNDCNKANNNLENKRQKYRNKQAFIQSIIMAAMVLSQLAYIVDVGYLTIRKTISPGSIVGLMSIASSFYSNIQNVISTKIQINASKPILEKLLKKNDSTEVMHKKSISTIKHSIKMDHVSFAYEDSEKNILNEETITFKIGAKYLIHGKSGVGKSTILKLISGRLTGYTGKIFYDDININELSSDCLKNLISYVAQDTYIFHGTIQYNITLGREYDPIVYKKAIAETKLDSFIASKPEGDQFILEEYGKNLSGGQRQRIALARAMLYQKPIWVIDEGLQGLDEDTANELENFLTNISGITLIMISHRDTQLIKGKYDKVIQIV